MGPLWILYEVSIGITRIVERGRAREAARLAAEEARLEAEDRAREEADAAAEAR